ncbi:MAG TPA: hydrolase [Ruminococcus sp.]|nr:hydrolase [Ruminococcus sp.]
MIWNAKNGSVKLGDTEMNYVSFGYGDKNLIVLPGLSDGLVTVKGKALLLAKPYKPFFKKYTVYMFSRKKSLPDPYSIREMAEDQANALKALGIRRTSVMGASQGGMIAQYLAIDHPELIDRLILAVSAPYANNIIQDCVGYWIKTAQKGDHKELMISTAEKGYSEKRLKNYRKIYPFIGHIGKPSDYTRFLTNADAILKFNALSELERINCPTLIIGGDTDKTVGIQASYELHEHIAGSRLFVYQGLGHAAYEEAPDFYQRIFSFLDE